MLAENILIAFTETQCLLCRHAIDVLRHDHFTPSPIENFPNVILRLPV